MTASPLKRRFRFSLRALLVVIAILAIMLGWFTKMLTDARRQNWAVVCLTIDGRNRVFYEDGGDTGNDGQAFSAWDAFHRRAVHVELKSHLTYQLEHLKVVRYD